MPDFCKEYRKALEEAFPEGQVCYSEESEFSSWSLEVKVPVGKNRVIAMKQSFSPVTTPPVEAVSRMVDMTKREIERVEKEGRPARSALVRIVEGDPLGP